MLKDRDGRGNGFLRLPSGLAGRDRRSLKNRSDPSYDK